MHHPYLLVLGDNSELYLMGEWLMQSGLTGQTLAVNVMPSKVIIKRR
ncbi:type I toxin-antitoxin system SymE family toxin [Serratia fonticola]|nr:type I toxin-antitoxin system SymE family toxin [Serratia fonticola]CAI0709384.1 HSP20-like domain of uncharacterised function (DUF1813) [Serratia fonticola]